MSERVSCAIHIGGPVPTDRVPDLCNQIWGAGVALDWGDARFEPETAEDLIDAVDEGVLSLYADQSSTDGFYELEAFLVEAGIPFDRQVAPGSEGSGELARFRPGRPVHTTPCDASGNPFVEESLVRRTIARLEIESHVVSVPTVIADLREAIGLDLPQLPPFTITAGRTA